MLWDQVGMKVNYMTSTNIILEANNKVFMKESHMIDCVYSGGHQKLF